MTNTMLFATLALVIVGVIILEILGAVSGPPSPGPVTSLGSTSTCTAVQPGVVFISVVSDTNQTPVAAAVVSATNVPGYCGEVAPTPRRP